MYNSYADLQKSYCVVYTNTEYFKPKNVIYLLYVWATESCNVSHFNSVRVVICYIPNAQYCSVRLCYLLMYLNVLRFTFHSYDECEWFYDDNDLYVTKKCVGGVSDVCGILFHWEVRIFAKHLNPIPHSRTMWWIFSLFYIAVIEYKLSLRCGMNAILYDNFIQGDSWLGLNLTKC
jgi:hypothetical protein